MLFRSGFIDRMNVLTGSDLPAAAPDLLSGITQNFGDLRIIGSVDQYSLTQDFAVTSDVKQFKIYSDTKYFRSSEGSSDGAVQTENVPSIFSDSRFSRFPNFLFLPPENLPLPGFTSGSVLAEYPRLNEKPPETLDEVLAQLVGKQKSEISFSSTSRFNNLVCQVFENSTMGVDKLSIVDFGNFDDENPGSPESYLSPGRRVFFAGKVRRDSSGAETFLCLFTIIID